MFFSRQPEFCKWAFNVPRGEACLAKWDLIPEDTDILVTHTPPIGHGDLCCSGVRAGCVELLSIVQRRVKPKYHIFGHIHEGYGISSDGKIIYINASTCDLNYLPSNSPIVFDITLPPGMSKTWNFNIYKFGKRTQGVHWRKKILEILREKLFVSRIDWCTIHFYAKLSQE